MTTSLDLLNVVHQAVLSAATDAGDEVYRPGDWPTQDGVYPIIKMRLPAEDRQSLGRSSAPQFTTTCTIRLSLEVSAPADINDGGASEAEAALWRLKRQVEVAVINSYPLTLMIQQIARISSQLAYNSDAATHLAGLQMDISLEFYEGPESFAPVDATDIDSFDVTLTQP